MRPERFQAFAIDLLKNTPGVTRVQTLADVGDTKHPYGVAVTAADGESRWQVIGQLAEGAKHDVVTPAVQGAPAPFQAAPANGRPADAWMAGAIGAAESPEARRIEVWSIREGNRPDHVGLTVFFHNGERVFVRKL
ncbi:hypothetical protein ACH40E_33580 [Streptomyces acidicola]|uniref:hypothetical protein n=1 Tax=Streptomyces acidicola TaxID=2596892 RepID=UPI0037AC58B2